MGAAIADKRQVCQVCGSDRPAGLHPAILVSHPVAELIERTTGSWSERGWICADDLARFRRDYVRTILEAEKGELTAIEQEVIESIREQELISRNPAEELQSGLTRGERLADRLAAAGGSWSFIIGFVAVLAFWIVLNSLLLAARPFDPYPYILLNLVLSCVAAIQAPVIMMSQNRQEARDRLHAMRDYQVNLKAEMEIRHLHEKLDHFLSHQWERLVQIQEVQMELMEEVRRRG